MVVIWPGESAGWREPVWIPEFQIRVRTMGLLNHSLGHKILQDPTFQFPIIL